MNDQKQPHDSNIPPQPVAYDTEGRPLYHHPPQAVPVPAPSAQSQSIVTTRPDAHEGHNFDPKIRAQYANEPSIVHAARSYEPKVPDISEALQRKHEESKQLYPFLNLSEGEFVILRIRRHPIGLLIPSSVTVLVLVLLSVALLLVPDFYASQAATLTTLPSMGTVVGGILLLMLFAGTLGGIAIWVYLQNQFFLTNESVIQEIQHGLFSRHEQTVSLGSIEDASFKQNGVVSHIFGYGLMRLSTEGEETTYRFNYVEDPKAQVATVNNAVEAFKNGRPVGAEFLK